MTFGIQVMSSTGVLQMTSEGGNLLRFHSKIVQYVAQSNSPPTLTFYITGMTPQYWGVIAEPEYLNPVVTLFNGYFTVSYSYGGTNMSLVVVKR